MDPSQPSVVSQPVMATLTRSAIFLVVTINPGSDAEATVRGLCADLSGLLRAVGFRDLQGNLSCVMAFGSQA
ncbi:Dyp-type peroxidase domain-containing protein, partial [Bosea sp. (in: a-proteobacteria)]|uniref:Dyp-type peroxidase domain-containing protein n=1 Tax=Bosea sp. (in: a-proteobacteria) TaxID=1871050 RepID=UPI001ACDB46B|nr:peroxidase [Bosea sp. (in: a-proteobacteria)]